MSSWEETAAKKRDQLFHKIPTEWVLPKEILDRAKDRLNLTGSFLEELLDSHTRRITSLDSVELVDAVSNGSFTAVQVATAFCKRTAFAHQLNCNLLEILFEPALERARELDCHFSKTNKPIGPLHGLPISLKDQFHVKGGETTMAYVGWIGSFEGEKGTGKEGNFESELVRELVALGAIPIAKTSLTQTLWCAETNNNILGYNWLPHNQELSSGGSSGGQGALQALRGTTLGFGTDVGGSVSIPAAFNGLYSLKPSHGRLPFKGVPNSSPGQHIIPTVVGIFGTDISCLQFGFRSLMAAKPWLSDPHVLEMPWNEDATSQIEDRSKKQKLYFGIMEDDGIVKPHPPILRAVRMVKEALRAKGYKTLAWHPPSHSESESIHSGITNADGCPDVIKRLKLSGEPVIPELETELGDEPQPPISLPQLYEWMRRLKHYREDYHNYWMSTSEGDDDENPVDAVILPVAPHAAVIPGKWYHYTYGNLANTLDRPTVVIPVTTADSHIDLFDLEYKPINETDRNNWLSYDAEKYAGAPASVQILGTNLGEEKLLRLAQAVVDALNDYKLGL
ncbi:amidase signature domain-containing protein [Talaromyces proteolyticus]|uniref:Amidase signature domain-containing protein n=1 Tax=Talaromyces proteolyticus TaxID=1131652 RepID=A0AAD4KWN4_9EURO|nr:amidase signature domain-containing protein [Talaromyces proteolyticus]KAH8698553.1 amidase signature domain-containing protein [Talaromyces proteolyticus]